MLKQSQNQNETHVSNFQICFFSFPTGKHLTWKIPEHLVSMGTQVTYTNIDI